MRRAHTVEQVRAAEAALMATLPEGTLMQRAAAGLAYAVIDLLGSAYGRRVRLLVGSGDNGGDALYAGALLARRGCAVEAWLLSDHAHEAGVAALRGAGGRVVRFDGGGYVALRRTTRRGGGRDRRDRGPARAAGRRRRPRWRRRRASRSWRSTYRPASTSTPASSTGRTSRPPSRSPSAPTRSPTSSTRPRPPAAPSRSSTSASTSRRRRSRRSSPRTSRPCCRGRTGTRTSTPAASSASAPGRRPTPAPACSASPAPRPGCAAWCGTSATPPWPTGSGRRTRRSSGTGGSRPGWSARVVATAPARRWRRPSATASRWSSTPTRWPTSHGPLGVPAVLTPHAGELAAMIGVDRADVEARPLHHARAAAATYDAVVLLKGRRTLVAAPTGESGSPRPACRGWPRPAPATCWPA